MIARAKCIANGVHQMTYSNIAHRGEQAGARNRVYKTAEQDSKISFFYCLTQKLMIAHFAFVTLL